MGPDRQEIESRIDLMMGKAALERGLLTPAQLREAVAEQAAGVARGRKRPRRLGAILVERHYLDDRQMLALREEQESILIAENLRHQRDKLVGFVLIEQGLVPRHQVLECLRIQAEELEVPAGRAPRLEDLLVRKGYAKAEQIRKAFLLQSWSILVCRTCLRQATVAELRPGEVHRCPECKVPMEVHGPIESLVGISPCAPPPSPPPPRPEKDIPTVKAPSLPGPEARKSPAAPVRPQRTAAPPLQSPPPSPKPPTPPRSPPPSPGGPPPAPQAPIRRFGKYAILREVGRGSMGVVYEALDTQLDRKVALKLMRTEDLADPQEVGIEEGRFIREAQMIAKVPKHPGIVNVYEAGVLEGRRYIAMEFIQGLPLPVWRKRGSVALRQQVRVLRDVALAVHHAHQHGVIHRDLKPLNILVDAENHACVTDFGLAKRTGPGLASTYTSLGEVKGTPAYMSPEQARGDRKVDARTDIYSLGAILYEILTGQPPFLGETPMAVLLKVVDEPVEPPSRRARALVAVPGGRFLEEICLKALSKNPQDRPSSAKAFADDLTTWLRGQAAARTAPSSRRLKKP